MLWSQDYYANGDVWKVYTKAAHQYPCVDNIYRNYTIQGDTIIDSVYYHQLWTQSYKYYTWESPLPPYPQCNGEYEVEFYLKGFIRNEGKKVIFKEVGMAPFLWFDFDLNIGDTIFPSPYDGPYNSVVVAIDTVFVQGEIRQRFSLENSFETYDLIKGIGSTFGLLEPRFSPYNLLNELQCYSRNSQNYFPLSASENCLFNLAVPQHSLDVAFFPNPVSDWLTVSLDVPAKLSVLDVMGTKKEDFSLLSGEHEFNWSNYESGIYWLQFVTQDGKISQKRVVKL